MPENDRPIPCIFTTEVLSDGIGDLFHFIDFLALLSDHELDNSYFVIHKCAKNELKIKSILSLLDDSHPLKRFRDKIFLVDSEHNVEEQIKNITSRISHNNFYNVYSVSYYYANGPLCTLKDPKCFYGFLGEHFGEEENSKHMLPATSFMGLNPEAPGIFIHPSEADEEYDPENTIFATLGIAEDEELSICYAHRDEVHAIHYFYLLQQRISTTGKLALFFPNEIREIIPAQTLSFLAQNNIRIINNNNWIEENDFKQLRLRQAKTANFSIAAGDKTTETCFREGLFPIIQATDVKLEFWQGFIVTLKTFTQTTEITKIINYIEASLIEPEIYDYGINQALTEAIQNLDESCFNTWITVICPYVREHFNVIPKIAPSVKLFRGLAEIILNPESIYAAKAMEDIITMPQDLYEQIITDYSMPFDGFTPSIEHPDHYLNTALQLSTLLSLRDCNIAKPEIKATIAEIIRLSKKPHLTKRRRT